MEDKDLLYARGYYIVKEKREVPGLQWNCEEAGGWYVYHHPALTCFCARNEDRFAVLLGTVMDTDAWNMDGDRIAAALLEKAAVSVEEALDYADVLCGRHVLFFRGGVDRERPRPGNEEFLLSDAAGMKSVYYDADMTCFASHAGLAAALAGAKNRDLREWQKEGYPSYLPGRLTPYENIYFLLPNTYAMPGQKEIRRFFPREELREQTLEEATDQMAAYLKKQTEVLAEHHSLMASLTGGKESRLTLAALEPYKDKVLYFTYCTESEKGDFTKSSLEKDVRIAKKVAGRLGLQHKVVWFSTEEPMDKSLKEALERNTVGTHIPPLGAAYRKELPKDALHLRSSVAEIGEGYYWKARRKALVSYPYMSPEQVVSMTWTDLAVTDPLALEAIRDFLRSSQYDRLYGYDPYDFLYWEQRIAVWHAGCCLAESDVAHDTWVLYNSRKFLKMMLSVPLGDRVSKQIIYRTIEKLWPLALYDGVNEEGTLADYQDDSFRNVGADMLRMEISSGSLKSDGTVAFHAKKGDHTLSLRFDSGKVQTGDFLQASWHFSTKGDGKGYWLSLLTMMPEAGKWKNKAALRIWLNDRQVLEEPAGLYEGMAQVNIRFQSVQAENELRIRLVALEDVEDGLFGWESRLLLERLCLRRQGVKLPLAVRSTSPAAKIMEQS